MKKEVKIGLIGIMAIAMLVFGINYLRGVAMFKSSRSYYVEFNNINGFPAPIHQTPARKRIRPMLYPDRRKVSSPD